MSTVRILIADHAPTRLGIRIALEGHVEVCGEAESAEHAIRIAKREQPDVCLIGWGLPGTGSVAVRGVARAAPKARVVVLANDADADAMLESVRLGAVGFVQAGLNAGQLVRVVMAAAAREAVLPRAMIHHLIMEVRSSAHEIDGVTGREAQVLALLRRGHSTSTIATRLNIEPVTVRRHISELVRKFGVVDRSELLVDGVP